jgi:N-methylhydantoinase A/oxoprolinase/acetone carboxylase beta subunit
MAIPCRSARRKKARSAGPDRRRIGFETFSIYDRAALAAGATIDGPAITEQSDTTTVVPRGWRCRAGEGTRLLIEMR